MIDALIVDDEFIVRKGLYHMFPWEEQGIRVVGEASNGEKALELMESNPIRLLITDLSMPIMDGFELIRVVRQRYPHVSIVVLTCHQDFHHIQEALRLGAIDYIVKTELESDTLQESILRFVRRLHESEERNAELPVPTRDSIDSWGLFLAALSPETEVASYSAEFLKNRELAVVVPETGIFMRAGDLKEAYRNKEKLMLLIDGNQWIPVFLNNIRNASEKNLIHNLTRYNHQRLYYDFKINQSVYEADWAVLESDKESGSEGVGHLLQKWKSFLWVYNDRLFEDMVKEVRKFKPPVSVWVESLKRTVNVWRQIETIPGAAGWPDLVKGFRYWEQWLEWLRQIRVCLRSKDLSEEVCISVLRALQIVWQDIHTGISQAEVANRVKINRSYFSYCFKQYVGRTFQSVLNEIRLDKANLLLTETQEPVYRIAELVGFDDEKYFSKFYKQHTGMLPSDYRRDH